MNPREERSECFCPLPGLVYSPPDDMRQHSSCPPLHWTKDTFIPARLIQWDFYLTDTNKELLQITDSLSYKSSPADTAAGVTLQRLHLTSIFRATFNSYLLPAK